MRINRNSGNKSFQGLKTRTRTRTWPTRTRTWPPGQGQGLEICPEGQGLTSLPSAMGNVTYVKNSRLRAKFTSSFLTVTETFEPNTAEALQCWALPMGKPHLGLLQLAFVECYHICNSKWANLGCISAFFSHIVLQCQEVRLLLELRSMMIFSIWRLSFYGTIAWLASDRLGHIMHWHWSWHWVFILLLIATHHCFSTHLWHTSFLRHTADPVATH